MLANLRQSLRALFAGYMRPTHEGRRFLFAVFLIGLAALNTGNNLIYIVFGLMCSVLVIAWVALRVNLAALTLAVNFPEPIYAGQAAKAVLTVSNAKRYLSSYSLHVLMPEGARGRGQVTIVAPGASASCVAEAYFPRRGVYSYSDFFIESTFPFLFFTKRIRVPLSGDVVVYPALMEVDEDALLSGQGDDAWTLRPGRGEELLSIRQFGAGDDMKMIHWKATAKADKLMVKDFSESTPKMVTIIIDDSLPEMPEVFERAVSYAASAAWKFIEQGYYVRLLSCNHRLPYGIGMEQLFRILDMLAMITEQGTSDCLIEEDMEGAGVLVYKGAESHLKQTLGPLCSVTINAQDI